MSATGRRVRLPSRQGVLTTALVVAALASGRAVDALTPDDRVVFGRPFLHEVAVGESVELRYARLTPTAVDGAPVLDRGADPPMQSPGLWVVTKVTVTPTLDAETLRHATFVDGRGRELSLGSRNGSGAPQRCPEWRPSASCVRGRRRRRRRVTAPARPLGPGGPW